jgi:acyl-CoA thioesterase
MADPLDHNQAEPGDISFALDVEKLDVDLYRSRNLSLPYFSRGVFGGQVISQALVAATSCVKPEFALHVSLLHPSRSPVMYTRAHHVAPRRDKSLHVRTVSFRVAHLASN